VPAPPEETLRGGLVLRGMARRLEIEAAGLREAGAAAARALEVAEQERRALEAAERAAREAEAAVEAELEEARRHRARAEEAEDQAAERAQAAAAQARDLAEAVQRLERERQRREAEERANAAARAAAEARRAAEEARERHLAEEARRRQAEARPADPRPPRESALPAPAGGRALPVAGRISTTWGEPAPGGPHRGLTFAASPGARVVSPCSGRAAFAAPFRSYGLLLIVDCGGGYHFVLAGLERLDVAAGRRLLAGEPVGVLGTGGAGASLYVELRRGGQAVDPRPWFAARG
jgi:septal ring factor EnvC (AmiA/AmiB activator)